MFGALAFTAVVPGCGLMRSVGGRAMRLRGAFPIMSVAYNEDGSVDYEGLQKEALFTARSGCPGVIWCQSNDAIDLLTFEEKSASYRALAKAMESVDCVMTFGCNGTREKMMKEAAEIEKVAAMYPKTKIAMISRPPDDGKTPAEIREYFEALAGIARRPVIIQTWVNNRCPAPSVKMLVELAEKHPDIYGWIKEESSSGNVADRIKAEVAAKPVIKTVFSAWGGWEWLFQNRQLGTEGLISERCAYAPLLSYIWKRMENGDADGTLAQAYALYRLLIDQRGFPGGLRGYSLYFLMKHGVFKNMVSRQYRNAKVGIAGTTGDASSWSLTNVKLNGDQLRELDALYDDMMRFCLRG